MKTLTRWFVCEQHGKHIRTMHYESRERAAIEREWRKKAADYVSVQRVEIPCKRKHVAGKTFLRWALVFERDGDIRTVHHETRWSCRMDKKHYEKFHYKCHIERVVIPVPRKLR